jgi:hypothetical protein
MFSGLGTGERAQQATARMTAHGMWPYPVRPSFIAQMTRSWVVARPK